ncbi:MAG TPA: phosphate acyltransferase PlsX [Caulobacteraceae bacterium]|nr:phosphate acyltransferase PlsX [Caulobacteraceae bacterium]
MPDSTVISIDAMGGDQGPPVAVAGVAVALEEWRRRGVSFLIHGERVRIQAELDRAPDVAAICEVRHTDLVINADDKAAQAMRRGKGTSLWNAIEAVKQGEARAAVSAGNTGALMAISMLVLRMVAGMERPAIVALWPSVRGFTTVLDVGANVECDADRLLEFAVMGEAFHRAMRGTAKPTVAILNVGSEDQKGHDEVREAHRMLRADSHNLDYRGFVEGDDISKGAVDVVVTDGFSGNIALKTAEGTARFIGGEVRAAFRGSRLNMLGALIARGALNKLRARLDPSAVNGGPLLGLNGIVVKSHGGSDAKGFANAIRVAVDLAQSQYLAEIQRDLEQLTEMRAKRSSDQCHAASAPSPENNG